MSHCLHYRSVVGKGIAVRLEESLLKQLYVKCLRSLHCAVVVALYIVASVIGYTSKGIDNGQYGEGSSVLAGCLKATGYCLFGYKRAHSVVYANHALCVVGQGGNTILRRMETCGSSVYYLMIDFEMVLGTELAPIVLLFSWQNKDDAKLVVVLIETFYGVHKHRFAGNRQELLGKVAAHTQTLATCNDYDIVHLTKDFVVNN